MSERSKTIAYCHACGGAMDVSSVAPFSNVECPKCRKQTRVKREFGPYMLVRRHAIGGMSMVFAAQDNTLGREVALKILSEEFSADERRIAAFEEEARITASFSHPNVVQVLTTGRAFDRFYIAMELVPGGHFEHQIRQKGRIPEKEMLPLAIEVAQGLKAARAAGLIHRDVKPGNILLDAEGHAKLVDFGLALVTQGGKAKAMELWATPYYVPPETVEGHAEDFRSDIYAFGATLYHSLAGKPSCDEESMATDVLREAKKKVIPLSMAAPLISAETSRIVERAMAYDPQSRYGSYDEMIADLGNALRNLKSGKAETTASAARRRAIKKSRERNTVALGLLAVVVVAGATVWYVNRKPLEPILETPPAVEAVAPPVEKEASTDIARSYREARNAVDAKQYGNALAEFTALYDNSEVQEPTRSWAGVEAVLVCYLDGQSWEGRKQALTVLDHLKAILADGGGFGRGLTETLSKLEALPPVPAHEIDPASGDASGVLCAMLGGLKNWEQGMLESASVCFEAVVSAELPPDAKWASIYQDVAGDYLADYQQLSGPLFSKMPDDKEGCESAIDDLNAVLNTLKTRGRARYNVRALQLDLTRKVKLLKTGESRKPAPVVPEDVPAPALADVLSRLGEFSDECGFLEAVAYLKSLPGDPEGATRASLLTVAESSAVFLADLEQDLAKAPVVDNLSLKSDETASKISIDATGKITAVLSDGKTRLCTWSDFSADALIRLHRRFVKNPQSEIERMRRHECAISFDWLAGNRERALSAASVLAQGSESFAKRWELISNGLPG